MDIECSNLFAVSLFAGKLDGFEAHQAALLERVMRLREEGGGMQASNQHAFHSQRDFHVAQDAATIWMCDAIRAFAHQILKPRMRTQDWRVVITHCWANATERGGWFTPHTHFPAPWAGVLYLDAERANGTAPHDQSGHLEVQNPISLPEAFGMSSNATFVPRDGYAVLFPGALQHFVHPHRSEHTRYAVSFNIAARTA